MIDEKKLINKLIIRREKLRYISIAALHNNMNYVDTVGIKYVLKDCPEYGLMDGYCIFGW